MTAIRERRFDHVAADEVGGGYEHKPHRWVGSILTRDQYGMLNRTWTCRTADHNGHATKDEALRCATDHIGIHCPEYQPR